MARNRTGLHKNVSSIFDGVPIPKSEHAPQMPPNQEKNTTGTGYTPPKTKPSTPVTPVEKPQQSSRPASKSVVNEKSKAGFAGDIKQYFHWQKMLQLVKDKLLGTDAAGAGKNQKLMVIVASVATVIFLFVLIKIFTGSPDKANAFIAAEPSGIEDSIKIDWSRPEPYLATIRDPMKIGSVSASQTDIGKPVVKGIVYSLDKATAVIGTKIMREGDVVNGAAIVKINADSVEFEMDGKRWTQSVQK